MNVKNLFKPRNGALDSDLGSHAEDWSKDGEAGEPEMEAAGGQELNRALADLEEHLSTNVAEPVGDDGFVDIKAKLHGRLVDQIDPSMLSRVTPAQIEAYIHELIPAVLEEEGVKLTTWRELKERRDAVDSIPTATRRSSGRRE